MDALLIVFFLVFPVFLMWLRPRLKLLDQIGVVTACYIVGIIVGNTLDLNTDITNEVLGPAVMLSIPLLLFNTDIGSFRRAGPQMLKAFGAGVLAVAIVVMVVTLLFESRLEEAWQVGGMAFGVYTGGVVNLNAIGRALNAPEELTILINAADLAWGGLLFLFLLTAAKPFYGRFLTTKTSLTDPSQTGDVVMMNETVPLKTGATAMILAVIVVGASAGISLLLTGHISEILMYLSVTTLGLLVAWRVPTSRIEGSYGLGNYFLYVFCLAIGSLASIEVMLSTGLTILAFIGVIVGASIILHIAFARMLKLDVDSLIISSTAGLYGPPFIAPVARAIGNPSLIPLGITMALVGFAIGNYGGILIGHLLKLIV